MKKKGGRKIFGFMVKEEKEENRGSVEFQVFSFTNKIRRQHENVTQLVLVSLRDGVEEGRRLSNEEKDPFERIDRGAV